MPAIDVMDSTWLAARPRVVAPIVAKPANWASWWPQLHLELDQRRGLNGVRWKVRAVRGHPGLRGSAEIWLEPSHDGVVAHFFLRLDPEPGTVLRRRDSERLVRTCRLAAKHAFWALGDDLDPGRAARLCLPAGR